MALRLGALQDALLDAGASPDKAAKAAEEVAAYLRPRPDLSPLTIVQLVVAAALLLTLMIEWWSR